MVVEFQEGTNDWRSWDENQQAMNERFDELGREPGVLPNSHRKALYYSCDVTRGGHIKCCAESLFLKTE